LAGRLPQTEAADGAPALGHPVGSHPRPRRDAVASPLPHLAEVLQVATARCTWPTLLVPALGPVRHGTGGHRLAHIARTLIATAEKIYRDHADLPGFDFGAVTVQLAKAVEVTGRGIVRPLLDRADAG